MIDEQFNAKRPPAEKRYLGKLETRQAITKAKGVQRNSPSRYMEEDRQNALAKVREKKKAETKSIPDPIEINPEKQGLRGPGI